MQTLRKAPMKVSIIVASLLPEFGIGSKGRLPWHLKKDMKFFKEVTTRTVDQNKKNVVIMGRNTYDSIPTRFRPLKGRLNVILSKNADEYREQLKSELQAHPDTLKIEDSLEKAIEQSKLLHGIEEVFIIGGAQVYNSAMSAQGHIVDRIFLTKISSSVKVSMDTFLKFDAEQWEKRSSDDLEEYLKSKGLGGEFQLSDNKEGEFEYSFLLLENKK